MSLRIRVLVAIALVLSLNAGLGAGLAAMRAHAALASELGAALRGAQRSVGDALKGAEGSQAAGLRRLVLAFDGDRHVRAVLLDPDRRPLLASAPFRPAHPAPGWFSALVAPRLADVVAAVPGGRGAVRLEPAPEADLSDSWLNFADLLMVLSLACVLGCGLVWLLIGHALAPLEELTASFRLIGAGEYQIRVAERGVSEIAGIGRAFNLMAGQLASMRSRNRLLEEQLLKLQDEERAELARDLHDDIGPYLFAVNVDAAVAAQLAAAGRNEAIPDQVKAIQASVAHMQARVREILGRLRPARLVELGLEPAIEDLVRFWRGRSPEVEFTTAVQVEEARLSDEVREAAFRVVQEGLSNAVRHGRPGRIAVELSTIGADTLSVVVWDDGVHAPEAPRREPGFGIAGMRERIALAGGVLEIARGGDGRGWRVTARLPMSRRRRAPRRAVAA